MNGSNCVFNLVDTGLVVVQQQGMPEYFTIIRPASLPGTRFLEGTYNFGVGQTTLLTNAPVASLRHLVDGSEEWEVDISVAAAPGPGPVWFREKFSNARDAAEAIRECYFGDRVDFESIALPPHYRRPRAKFKPSVSELDSERAVRIARGILEGSTPVFLGCQYLLQMLECLRVHYEEPFVKIANVVSELVDSPISSEEREHWSEQALAREDAKLAARLPKIQPAVFEACRAVLRRFAKDRYPPLPGFGGPDIPV